MLSIVDIAVNEAEKRSSSNQAKPVEALFNSTTSGRPAGRGLPGGNSLFFCVAKRKVSKRKGSPAVCVPCAALRGNLRCSVQPGSRSNSPSAQTIASPDPSGPALLGAYRRVLGSDSQSGSGEGALCAPSPPRLSIPSPSGWAEERRQKRIRAGTCLSEASLCLTPLLASTAGCPQRSVGTQTIGSPFFSLGFFGEAKKSKSPAGASPGLFEATAVITLAEAPTSSVRTAGTGTRGGHTC
jgi:hypothetical protein